MVSRRVQGDAAAHCVAVEGDPIKFGGVEKSKADAKARITPQKSAIDGLSVRSRNTLSCTREHETL